MSLNDSYAHCDTLLKAQDYDRWLACLFLPANSRKHAHALYAFSSEIARVRDSVREALPGEIRLQYWRDVLNAESSDNPVAAALLDTVKSFRLPLAPLQNLIDARVADLYDDGFATQNDLEGYCGETCSVLFQLVAMVAGGEANSLSEAAGHAGVAYAMAGLLSILPVHQARGQCYLPETHLKKHNLAREDIGKPESVKQLRSVLLDMIALAGEHLQKAQSAIAALPPNVRPAFLPLALVHKKLESIIKNPDPARTLSTVAGWRKILALWLASTRT